MRQEEEKGAKEAFNAGVREFDKDALGQVGSYIGLYDDVTEHNTNVMDLAKLQGNRATSCK